MKSEMLVVKIYYSCCTIVFFILQNHHFIVAFLFNVGLFAYLEAYMYYRFWQVIFEYEKTELTSQCFLNI